MTQAETQAADQGQLMRLTHRVKTTLRKARKQVTQAEATEIAKRLQAA